MVFDQFYVCIVVNIAITLVRTRFFSTFKDGSSIRSIYILTDVLQRHIIANYTISLVSVVVFFGWAYIRISAFSKNIE